MHYALTQDANGKIYIKSVVSTATPGSNPLVTKSGQTLDVNGNITHQDVYGLHPTTPPLVKSYDLAYLTDSNYTSRYIRNRWTQAAMTPAGRLPIALVTN